MSLLDWVLNNLLTRESFLKIVWEKNKFKKPLFPRSLKGNLFYRTKVLVTFFEDEVAETPDLVSFSSRIIIACFNFHVNWLQQLENGWYPIKSIMASFHNFQPSILILDWITLHFLTFWICPEGFTATIKHHGRRLVTGPFAFDLQGVQSARPSVLL